MGIVIIVWFYLCLRRARLDWPLLWLLEGIICWGLSASTVCLVLFFSLFQSLITNGNKEQIGLLTGERPGRETLRGQDVSCPLPLTAQLNSATWVALAIPSKTEKSEQIQANPQDCGEKRHRWLHSNGKEWYPLYGCSWEKWDGRREKGLAGLATGLMAAS